MSRILVLLVFETQERLHIWFYLYRELSLEAEAGGVSVSQTGKPSIVAN